MVSFLKISKNFDLCYIFLSIADEYGKISSQIMGMVDKVNIPAQIYRLNIQILKLLKYKDTSII